MIAQASKNSLAAPSGYSEMLSSAVGKPLALVHIGCSLELATGQLTNQSSSRTGMPADKTLLKPSDTPSGSYSFPIKIGDRNRLFDGMVGYFNVAPKGIPGDLFDLQHVHTYFTAGRVEGEDARVAIKFLGDRDAIKLQDAPAPVLMPTWVPPYGLSSDPASYAQAYNAQLLFVGALIDPFTPVIVYSGILPPSRFSSSLGSGRTHCRN
jgi:hypothetical protein